MAEMEKIVEKKIYEDGYQKRNWATKGEALGIGIPALVLGGLAFANQMNRGGLGLFGGNNGVPENVNINNVGGGSTAAPTAFQAWEHGCEEAITLTNEIWRGRVADMQNAAAAREVDVNEKFGLYKATRDLYDHTQIRMAEMGFGLYKGQRDLYDVLNERYAQKFCDLDKKVAVLEATRPYQDKLIQCEIDRAFNAAVNYTDRKTCRAIYGVVGLPSTPTVTVFEGANPYGCNAAQQAQTQG